MNNKNQSKLTLKEQEQRLAYLLLVPPLLLVVAVILGPVLWNFWLSLKPISVGDLGEGTILTLKNISLQNFKQILTNPRFYQDLTTTFVYTFFGVSASLLFGLLAALLLNRSFAGRQWLRGLYLFPYVAPVVAVAYVSWTWILDPASGIVSWSLLKLGLVEQPPGFLTEQPYALLSIICFQTWRYGPFCMLFILARLQSIPSSLYDAAKIDGASPVQRFFLVTLPHLKEILATLFLLRFMWTFNKFDDVYLLTEGSGNTEILPIYLYNLFIGQQDLGAGAALAVILFVILSCLLFIYFRYVLEEW